MIRDRHTSQVSNMPPSIILLHTLSFQSFKNKRCNPGRHIITRHPSKHSHPMEYCNFNEKLSMQNFIAFLCHSGKNLIFFKHSMFTKHVGHGGALVEMMTFNRRVVGSTPALAAT